MQKIFKENMPDIIAEVNSKIVNWLDVVFNLENGTYKPFKKPRDEMKNIHVESQKHPYRLIPHYR